jgi:hypothetical protein
LNAFIRLFATFILAMCIAPVVRAADPTDPAELFPPGTLAYVEIHDPASVGPQLAAAFKGTAIEDSIAFIHKLLAGPGYGASSAARLERAPDRRRPV